MSQVGYVESMAMVLTNAKRDLETLRERYDLLFPDLIRSQGPWLLKGMAYLNIALVAADLSTDVVR